MYILVLDFEATCEDRNKVKRFYPQEIIEWPCIVINTETLSIDDKIPIFHHYIKPVLSFFETCQCKLFIKISLYQDSFALVDRLSLMPLFK